MIGKSWADRFFNQKKSWQHSRRVTGSYSPTTYPGYPYIHWHLHWPSWQQGESCTCTFVGADITRGRQQQGAYHPLVQELRFDDAICGKLWLFSCQKSAWRQALFSLKLNFFQLFFTLGAGQKNTERRLKKHWGCFPKALCYIGI